MQHQKFGQAGGANILMLHALFEVFRQTNNFAFLKIVSDAFFPQSHPCRKHFLHNCFHTNEN